MHRRALLGGAAALALMSQGVRARTGPPSGPGIKLPDLPVFTPTDNVLTAVLDMKQVPRTIGGTSLTLATYNGQVPGAVYKLKPGDTLSWQLKNNMTQDLGLPLANGPVTEAQKKLNYTNIHVHGLQVNPDTNADGSRSDNVYDFATPGTSLDYTYLIPGPETGRPQPGGMFWYHPHKHGSTSHQGWQGLAGPIIIEGPIDEVPEIKAATERVMVLSEIMVNDQGETPTALIVPTVGEVPFTSRKAMSMDIMFPVNGVIAPEIDIQPGEVQRWRILASGPHRFFQLNMDGLEMHQIGQDGIPFDRPRPVQTITMAPGNRVELLVKGPPEGRYGLRALAFDQGHPGGPRPERYLATLVSSGSHKEMALPAKLVPPPEIPAEALPPVRTRTVTFKGDIASVPVKFYLDGQVFNPDRIDQQVKVGTTEDWELVNEDVFQHPFHIHVNPFQVVEINGEPVEDPVWWDVFAIPPRTATGPGRCKIRMYFRPDIKGKTVYHCHILPHEDNGMMANILLADEADEG